MPDLRNFDLNLLHAFKLLMEERSVSRAAEKMFISQSAMSHILQRLRNQLDDPLLVKTTSGMQPTARAEALLEPVTIVLNEIQCIMRSPREFSPVTSHRRFLIAASDYVEFTLLPRFIELINKSGPNIEIHVRQPINNQQITSIFEEDIDIVIGFDAVFKVPSYFRREKLFSDKIVCIARQNHQRIIGNEFSFEQFISSGHMLISPTGAGKGLIDDHLAARGLARKISLVVPNFLAAPWILANTDLLLSLPLRIAERFIRLAPLKILPIPIDLPIYNLIMIWHPRQEKEPDHQWLRSEILRLCLQLDKEAGQGANTCG